MTVFINKLQMLESEFVFLTKGEYIPIIILHKMVNKIHRNTTASNQIDRELQRVKILIKNIRMKMQIYVSVISPDGEISVFKDTEL